ncbi:hypothetical protein GCM10010330_57230 [Streptomyces tendae]|uniref:hypothetical protein n=1 Tax=Streptomyces tendae TaxID=1932 RepID=UPI00167BDEFF|nr:hypothetical protein [Streptomyces tendae]GHA95608.1 hypothetical protein GCM10010330_57230 [Streptomyces tendae]
MPFEPWQPGMTVTASRLASISPTWQDWTPVWTTSGASTPSFGNAAITARWAQSALTIHYQVDIVFGSTTTFGSGTDNWRLSTPVPAAATSNGCGSGEISRSGAPSGYGSGAGTRQPIRIRLTTTQTFEFEMSGGNINAISTVSGAGLIDASTPWSWDNGSSLRFWGSYEAAP